MKEASRKVLQSSGGGAASPVAPALVDTIGVNTEGTEVAYTDEWAVETDRTKGLDWYIMNRVGFFHDGDQKLYGYIRKATFDKAGRLTAVSAETRVEIDAPEICP